MSQEKLPMGWKLNRLGDVCTKPQYGWTSKAIPVGNVRYIRTTDLTKGKINWETVPFCELEPDNIEKYQVMKDDILISRAGSVGFSFRIEDVPSNTIFASYLIRFKPNKVSPKYIEYFLKSPMYWKSISEVSAGIAVQNINASKLSDLEIPIAPLPEQQLIVARLDAVFGHLDTLREKLDRIPELLKNFRQQVLTQAVTGDLTKEWREGKDFGDWEETTIGDVSNLVTKGSSPKWQGINYVDSYSDDSILFITSENVDRFGIIESKFKFLEKDFNDLQKRSILKKGDVLTNIVGGSIGRTATWNLDFSANINQAVCLIRLDNRKCLSDYLTMYLNSDLGLKSILSDVVDVARANVSLKNIKETRLLLPSIEEQLQIIKEVDSVTILSNKIESQYQSLKAKIDQLPHAILAKAFRGELVGQEMNEYVREVEELGMVAEEGKAN